MNNKVLVTQKENEMLVGKVGVLERELGEMKMKLEKIEEITGKLQLLT